MSFMLTQPQMRERTKSVTRRMGWWNLKPFELVAGIEKGQGLKKGEHPRRICTVKIIETRHEKLRRLTDDLAYGYKEVQREGFPDMTPAEFVAFFCKSHRGCTPDTVINRIEFGFVE